MTGGNQGPRSGGLLSSLARRRATVASSEPPAAGLGFSQLFVFGVILYFTFLGGSFYSDLNFSLRVFNHVVVTVLLGAWLFFKLRRGEPLPRTLLDAPILAWLAALSIAAIFGLSPRFSLEKLWIPFTQVLAFYLLVDLRQKKQTPLVARGLYLSAGVVCLVGLAEFAGWYFGLPLLSQFTQSWPAVGGLRDPFPPNFYRLNFTLNGATPLSSYLALLIPPALAIWLTSDNRDNRQSIAAWLVLAVIVETLSFSRGGVLALLVSLPLTGLGWWFARRHGDHLLARAKELLVARRTLVIGFLAVFLILIILIGPAWLARTFDRQSSTQFRFTLWKVALADFQEHPLTGVGPYNFGRSLLHRNDSSLPRRQIMTAHNVYLNVAAETGLLGLAAGAWLLLAAARAWLVRWRRTSEFNERVQVAATGAALAGLAAHSLVDTFAATPNVLPLLAIAAFALAGAEDAGHLVQAPAPRIGLLQRASSASTAVVFLLLLAYAVALAWLDTAQFYFQRSIALSIQREPDNALLAADNARRLDPAMPLYTFQLAYLQGGMTDDFDATRAAIQHYRVGLDAEPVQGRQTANLAAVLWRAGDRQAAIDALARAVMVQPDPIWLVNLAYFYEQVGDVDRAIETYGHALALAPGMAGSQFWQATSERAAQWQAILAQAEQVVTVTGADRTLWRLRVSLAEGDWSTVAQQAREILDEAPGDCSTRSILAQAHLQAGNVEEAAALVQQAIDLNQACGSAYLVRGLIRQKAGHLAEAERDWRTAIFLDQREAAYPLGQFYQARGDSDMAARFYLMALSPTAVPTDVEITLYDRAATFDLLPPLFRIGISPAQAEPWLALGRLREEQGDSEGARQVYEALLSKDPYLAIAQEKVRKLAE